MYHSVNGWYISTSPENYRTHVCHVKATKNKHIINTVQFKHTHITNPTVTHSNKVMKFLSKCVTAIQGLGISDGNHQVRDLKRVFIATKDAIQREPDSL